jgi:RNA polymerase sigma-70 factor (ECF subfamily)
MTPANPDEQDRRDMEQLATGVDSALDNLMSRHSERLFHYLVRVLQNETEAADLAEETFVRIYQNRSKFKSHQKFSSWAYTIATNLARDVQRYRVRHPNVSLDLEQRQDGSRLGESLPDAGPGPVESLDASERAEEVRRAVGTLPEEMRIPLVLFIYEEKSHAEISEILKCSAKAVEMRLYHARQQLRERLQRLLVG